MAQPQKQDVEYQEDGSYRITTDPDSGVWHQPQITVPREQWTPDTGMTRYEWARKTTPKHQIQFFQEFQQEFQTNPPQNPDLELLQSLSFDTMPNGSRGVALHHLERVRSMVLRRDSPDKKWGFSVFCGDNEDFGGICDTLLISCVDFITLADWELLVRFRSWVINDSRSGFIWLPGFEPGDGHKYNNIRPNAMQMVCPRK